MNNIPKDLIYKFDEIKFKDERGFNKINFEDLTNNISLKESFSKKNVFRGMHIQIPPYIQSKYIRVLSGKIIDFIIPLDSNRQDFGHIYSFEINELDCFNFIPSYCAHGFYALEDTSFQYVCLGKYNEESEMSIKLPGDQLTDKTKIISIKDKSGIDLNKALEICAGLVWKY